MSDLNTSIECPRHGSGTLTYVCNHLRGGVACGYCPSDSDPDDPYPDAWCGRCEEVRIEEGGAWNDTSEAFAEIQLLCSQCYDETKARNSLLPAGVPDGVGQLRRIQAANLLEAATQSTERKQEAFDAATGFLSADKWFYEPETSELRFDWANRPSRTFRASVVGSFSTRTHTWMWSWFNEGVSEVMQGDVWQLRQFGVCRGLERVAEPHWDATELDGWEMTSLAAHILGADAVYRAPMDHQLWFMLLFAE